MNPLALALTLAVVLVPAASGFAATPVAGSATPAAPAPADTRQLWAARGGTVEVRWNRDLAGDVGMRISPARGALPGLSRRGRDRFELQRSGSLAFHVEHGYFRGFDGGSLQSSGGYTIALADGSELDFSSFRLRPSATDPLILDFVGSDGQTWFYVDRLMYELVDNNQVLAVGAMDMRISPRLAQRIGHPEVAGWAIADLAMTTEVLVTGSGMVPLATSPHWPGTAAPNGGTWQADLFMQSFEMEYTRCQGCTGPSGTGSIVFTPTSSLRNNANGGTSVITIPGQGAQGTSSALWAASIPWNEKFTGNFPPYGNDQHAYLIWNLYRTNANGSFEQIARSGAKHAWETNNNDCLDPDDHDGHVLGRGCSDTYGTGNNDTSSELGPRSEIVPATGIWGRCGSIYDPNCDGIQDTVANGPYDQRLVVNERQVSPALNPGATYLFESWYIARDDINPYNSMATVTGVPTWNGGTWSPGGGGNYKLGPAIDRWVDPLSPPVNAKSAELVAVEGHAKLAVKAIDLGNGQWRYDYAVMNVDFARAVTSGAAPNVRVLGDRGFNRFSVSVPPDATVSSTRFSDGDSDAGNDWSVTTTSSAVNWNAPASGNSLDWGTLFAFSLTVNKPPVSGTGELGVAQAGTPAAYTLPTLAPSASAVPIPVASVSPASLHFNLVVGESGTNPMQIGNVGAAGSALAYAITEATTVCASASDLPWLSVAPTAGSVASGATATVGITADSTGLEAGGYSGKLCVATSDPGSALIEVPVTLGVNETPSYTIGGTVSGLLGTGLELVLNGGTDLPISGNGAFTFPIALEQGTHYTVTVDRQPANPTQVCTVANGSGTVGNENVGDIVVTCSGGGIDLIFRNGFDG